MKPIEGTLISNSITPTCEVTPRFAHKPCGRQICRRLSSYTVVVFGGVRRSILILFCTPFVVEVNNTIVHDSGSITILVLMT